jgi:hypothetical protein
MARERLFQSMWIGLILSLLAFLPPSSADASDFAFNDPVAFAIDRAVSANINAADLFADPAAMMEPRSFITDIAFDGQATTLAGVIETVERNPGFHGIKMTGVTTEQFLDRFHMRC